MARILIIEDEELVRQLYTDFLEKKGYNVKTAENGQKALDFLSDNKPDLILLDMNMSELNGKEFLNIIKADNKIRNIPVLLMSGNVEMDEEIAECLSLGAVGWIERANSPVEVMNKIEMVLGAFIEKPGSNPLTEGPRKLSDLDLGT